jgi:hypothetical protein
MGSLVQEEIKEIEDLMVHQAFQVFLFNKITLTLINYNFLYYLGERGEPGIGGLQGDKGDRGPGGFPGLTGAPGLSGLKGERGSQGLDV